MARALEGRPLVVRTLDVGADKPLPALPMAPESNPFLGVRGIRVGLRHPELLLTQLAGLGVSELSMAPRLIPELKAALRGVDLERARAVAQRALEATSPQAAREQARELLQADGAASSG